MSPKIVCKLHFVIPLKRIVWFEHGYESSKFIALWRSELFNATKDMAIEIISFPSRLRCSCAFQNKLSFTKCKEKTDLSLEEHGISNMIKNKNDTPPKNSSKHLILNEGQVQLLCHPLS